MRDCDLKFAVTYLLPEEAAAFEEAIDLDEDRLILRRVDAINAEAVTSFMKEVADTWGAIHHLCSLVGGWAGGRDVEETDDVRFERMLDLNLRSAFYAVRAAVPHLRQAGWGRILLVGSKAVEEAPRARPCSTSPKPVSSLHQDGRPGARGLRSDRQPSDAVGDRHPATRAALPTPTTSTGRLRGDADAAFLLSENPGDERGDGPCLRPLLTSKIPLT